MKFSFLFANHLLSVKLKIMKAKIICTTLLVEKSPQAFPLGAACIASVISYLGHIAQWAMIFGGGRRDDRDNGGALGGLFAIIIAPFAAMLIQAGISRSREYEADKSGGEICGNPNALADALLKIEAYAHRRVMPKATEATAHMFIINPLAGVDFSSLFSTHPKTADRVARLREQAKSMR